MTETLVVRAELAELVRVVDWAEAAGRRLALPESTLFAIHLCLEEAISNIVRHGGDRDADINCREVRLGLRQEADQIVLTIEDSGRPFDPFSVPPPAQPTTVDEASTGGWGVHLMRRFALSHAYQRQNGINRLILRFAKPS